MNPTLRVVLSWVAIGAGIASWALGYGLWIFVVCLAISHVLRYTFKPRIPDISERGHPVLSLSLIIAFLGVVLAITVFLTESHTAHTVMWIIAVLMSLYFMYDDIRICRGIQKTIA